MSEDLWSAGWLSLRVALLATSIAVVAGVPLAYLNARRNYPGRSAVDALLVLPIALPPTVVGFLLIALLGSRGVVGQYLKSWFDYSILFRFEAAVLAAALAALPLVYLPTRAGFAAMDRDMEDNARVMGANRWQVAWHVSLPLVRRSLLSGVILAFARALGEFGATVMVLGIRPGKSTLPISIYLDYEQGHFAGAWPAVALLCAISLAMVAGYNRLMR
jgi:molybdate transport system permease protein